MNDVEVGLAQSVQIIIINDLNQPEFRVASHVSSITDIGMSPVGTSLFEPDTSVSGDSIRK